MVSDKTWSTINVSLTLIAILLLLNILGVTLPSLGQARYLLDPTEPLCLVKQGEELISWNNLERCCLEARKLSSCTKSSHKETDWSCLIGGEGYLLNNKAYNYCLQQPYW